MAESSVTEHQCTVCKQVKGRSDFYQTKRGWICQPCKPCAVKRSVEAAKKNAIKRGKLCKCGCGGIVSKKTSHFCHGHAVRTPEYAKLLNNLRRNGGRPSQFSKRGTKPCTDCGETKAISEFYLKTWNCLDGNVTQTPGSRCKVCHNNICKDYAKRNKIAVRAYQRVWREINAEKLREQKRQQKKRRPEHYKRESQASRYKRKSKAGAGYNKTLKAIKEAIAFTLEQYRVGDQYLDVYSGELIDKPTIDHIVPISQGGDNSAENMCVTSAFHNTSKHRNSLLIWLTKKAQRCQSFS